MFLFLLQLIILYQSASIPACIIHYVEVLMKCAIVVVSCCYLCVDAEHKCDTSPYHHPQHHHHLFVLLQHFYIVELKYLNCFYLAASCNAVASSLFIILLNRIHNNLLLYGGVMQRCSLQPVYIVSVFAEGLHHTI